MQRIELFDCPMDVASMDETVAGIEARIQTRRFTQHVVVNVAKLVNMQTDPALRASVCACDLINIDGMGVVFAGRALGHRIPERVAGIDLFEHLLEMAERRRFPVFFLGATQPVVARVVERCTSTYPQLPVAGYHHGYFWDDERAMVDMIRASGARLLFVAITSPQKEIFIDRWRDELGVDFVMGVGGTFDVVAGKVSRAPRWMQQSGLEWLYRLLKEPRRMWRRYLGTNARFAWMLLSSLIRSLRHSGSRKKSV